MMTKETFGSSYAAGYTAGYQYAGTVVDEPVIIEIATDEADDFADECEQTGNSDVINGYRKGVIDGWNYGRQAIGEVLKNTPDNH